MKDFLLVFRRENAAARETPSPEQLQARMKLWQDWMGSLAAQNKLVDQGNRLSSDGRVVKSGKVVTNGPYVEIGEAVGGYTMIRANSLDEAVELSKDCPILMMNGNVEVRAIVPMDNNG